MNKPNNTLLKNNSTKNNSTKNNVFSNILGNTTNTKNSTATATSSQSTGYSGSNVIGIILLIVIIIIVLGASYWAYNYYTTKTFATVIDTEVMPDIKDATGTTSIASSTIPSSSFSNEYSISCWINVKDYNYNYGQEKVILRRGGAGSGNPEIVLDKKQNNLIVRVKLQGAKSSVSNFQDIPIQLKSQNVGMGFITPESVNMDSNNTSQMTDMTDVSDIPESFKKIGSNDIDYPTIHYTIDNNSSDSSQCGYFDLISGNNVNNSNKIIHNGNKLVEGFASTDDVINATVAVIVDVCNIAKTIQSQQFADDSVEVMNNAFKLLIDALEASRTAAKSGGDVNNAVSSLSSSMSLPTQQSDTILSQQFATLMTDINTLSTVSTNEQPDYKALFTAINSKMSTINCPLTIDSTSEIDGTISFYENIINLIKKSMFSYINNMGSGIKKIYPELENKQSASCLIDNNTNHDPTVGTCIVKMIPLQKWVNIIVSVYNQIIDIYIDGQLSSSCVLKGFPAISTDSVNITPDGGFSGKIGKVVFSNTAMTVTHAKKIYYAGPVASSSLFSMIPNWAYWSILILVIIAIGYSFLM
jgi:hypothetical protein